MIGGYHFLLLTGSILGLDDPAVLFPTLHQRPSFGGCAESSMAATSTPLQVHVYKHKFEDQTNDLLCANLPSALSKSKESRDRL